VAIIIEMPKLSDTMSQGKILSWMKREGEPVKAGDVLAEIESDKANMEMEAYDTGFVRKLLVPVGASAPVGAPIAIVTETADEDIAAVLRQTKGGEAPKTPGAGAGEAAPSTEEAQKGKAQKGEAPRGGGREDKRKAAAAERTAPVGPPAGPPPGTWAGSLAGTAPPARDGQRRVRASPLAFRMAAELGVNLLEIPGSGPEGRVVKRDVERALEGAPGEARTRGSAPVAAPAPPASASPAALPFEPTRFEGSPAASPASFEEVPVSSMRRIIGTRLSESKQTAPHYYVTVEIDMKAAIRAREEINKLEGVSITFNDLVVKGAALALARHPNLNASWQGEFIRYSKSVDIGVAVALPDGLITPVVRSCHLKSLGRISREIKELAEKAKQKKLTPNEYQGGTFTVSNLGMLGVKHFTAIINPPQAAILAVSAIEEVPVVENGSVVPGHRMCVTLSSDHRLVDGAQAASFLKDLKRLLENPTSLAL
jgi:pyruvate dehydrogenase E2 component (dihydrolipoamide acetyltransferase)